MKSIAGRQLYLIVFLLLLLFVLPLVLYLSKQRQDIRPKALVGAANFLLNSDLPTAGVSTGQVFNVAVSLNVTNSQVKLSGVDFVLLYDKRRLEVKLISPAISGPSAYFSEAPIVTSGGSFDDDFAFLRVAEVAKKPDANLSSGTIQLAMITFKTRGSGNAIIKFPGDNKYLQVSGIGPTGVQPSVPVSVPTCTSWETMHINECSPLTEWQKSPRSENCKTSTRNVTLKLNATNATQMAFYELTTGNLNTTYCETIADASFGTNQTYAATKSWTLSSGLGQKKVCVKLTNAAGSTKCGGMIEVVAAPN